MNRENSFGIEHGESKVRQELAALGLEIGHVYKFQKGDSEFFARLEIGLLGSAEAVHLVLERGRHINLPSLDGFDITGLDEEQQERARKKIDESGVSDAEAWYG